MYQNEQIIEQLGIADLPDDQIENIVNEAQVRIGEAVSTQLTDEQLNEYQAIIDGDEQVIEAWLDKNVPNYKDAAAYQSFEEGYEEDPEKNDPKKLFASLAWVQFTVPQLQEVVATALESFKQEREVR
jgi:protein-tyrosine-phosphatase